MSETQAIAVLVLAVSNLGAIVGAFWKLNNEVIELKTLFRARFETQEKENIRFDRDLNALGNLYRTKLNNKNQEDFL